MGAEDGVSKQVVTFLQGPIDRYLLYLGYLRNEARA